MNFNLGEWVVEALKVIERSVHLRNMGYGLVLAVILCAISLLRWW